MSTDNNTQPQPSADVQKVVEQATKASAYMFQTAAEASERRERISGFMQEINERFDAYEVSLVDAGRAKAAAEDRSRTLEGELVVERLARAEEVASLRGEHGREMARLAAEHAAELEAERARSAEEGARVREGVERLREDLGRRFAAMEGRIADLLSENARLQGDNEELVRSMMSLINAVETSARSLQAEDGALSNVVQNVSQRPVPPRADLPSDVIRLHPQRQAARLESPDSFTPAGGQVVGMPSRSAG